jgi:hypothetical protein
MDRSLSIEPQYNHSSKKSAFFGSKNCPFFKPIIQRKENATDQLLADEPTEQYVNNLDGSGSPLDESVRQFFEPKFGHDFSGIRIHHDTASAQSANGIQALAYTAGSHIVFNEGQYAPGTTKGDRLLAHELTHTVQQSDHIQPKKIQRATVMVNYQPIQIDFGNVIYVIDYPAGIQSAISTYTSAPVPPATITALTGLTEDTQRWLLFALDILVENTTADQVALNRTDAVNRLIDFAPTATTHPLGNNSNIQAFAREVLVYSGWTEVTVASDFAAPGSTVQNTVNNIVNPPAAGGTAPGPLDVNMLNTRLDAGLRNLLVILDPARITNIGTQSISSIQAIGDIILEEARSYFQPYSDAAINSVFNVRPTWVASSNISDTTAIMPDQAQRLIYLANRAQLVGRNTTSLIQALPDTNIFADTNFDGSRAADKAAVTAIISAIESDTTYQPVIDRIIQHTGFQTGGGTTTRIGINPEFNMSTTTECQARWRVVATLCHEVLHALAHPNFRNIASTIAFPQVTREGFTEVLGEQLYNMHVIFHATDPAFKAQLEQGLATAPCPPPAAGTLGYGSAAAGALAIRAAAGESAFRAAYFLGRTDLIGL